ncbi:MAG: sulfide/dihydroorotate dehydrogenase-like FAD/NAD-binding protein, partial [Planctomycetia bacterium]|nr:sulfide/dihydroorotate dehydrogenase-like FAD/NAD-binding protein [Planctomycetia bacterium]
DRLRSVSDEYILLTDDGSAGRKALVTEPLKELLEADRDTKRIQCVYAIGPGPMMKFCALTTEPFGVRTIVSLNSIMVDGTGMCGGCRVELKDGNGGTITRFTCTDGPEFDAHTVLWDRFLRRQKIYCEQEKCSMTRYVEESPGSGKTPGN